MHSRTIRLLTAMAVVGLCAWPVWKGVDVTRFAMAGSEPEAVRPWVDVPGVAFAAREDALTSINDLSDDQTIRKRRDEIAEILAIKPLSSYYWMQLADARIYGPTSPWPRRSTRCSCRRSPDRTKSR